MLSRSTSLRRFAPRSLSLLPGFLLLLYAGCTTGRPCETTRQCDSGDVCAASLCQALSCSQPLFLTDPSTKRCVALSGCFITEEQRDWSSCADADPCGSLAEKECLANPRCQPTYALGDSNTESVRRGCYAQSPGLPMGASLANQNSALHPPLTCADAQSRSYAGCRLVPELPEPCSALDEGTCETRQDCEWGSVTPTASSGFGTVPACVDRRLLRTPDCNGLSAVFGGGDVEDQAAREVACLLNPRCQPTGTDCYCPPGATCPCSGGDFVACEHNDRLVHCDNDGDCASGQTCRKSLQCLGPRVGLITAVPTTPCLGVCATGACGGLDEASCSARSECFAVYATECSSSISRYYQVCPLNAAGSAVAGCLCDNVFQRCADVAPVVDQGVTVRAERSLLVRDPEIISDAAFKLENVMKGFATPGKEEAFVSDWLKRFYTNQVLGTGKLAEARPQLDQLLALQTGGSGLKWLAEQWHTTALINRPDLIGPGDCGEARIAFAYNGGYSGTSNRMTLIVELKVPDDGQGCKQAAAQWLELSAIDDPAERLLRLKALYGALLRPEHLGQVRSNEFINPARRGPWELREWHLEGGELVLAPAKQAVDLEMSGTRELQNWVAGNRDAIVAGTVEVPTSMLSAAVVADGRMLRVPGSRTDAPLRSAEAALNKLHCAGCHVGSTGTPFVHIGERLADAQQLKPTGRAVVSEFLFNELPQRAATLRAVWQGRASLQAMRKTSSLRVH